MNTVFKCIAEGFLITFWGPVDSLETVVDKVEVVSVSFCGLHVLMFVFMLWIINIMSSI